MGSIGPMEILVIMVIALIVVGPTKLPEIGRAIGRALREFRRAQDEVQRTLTLDLEDEEPPKRAVRSSARLAPGSTASRPTPAPAARQESQEEPTAEKEGSSSEEPAGRPERGVPEGE